MVLATPYMVKMSCEYVQETPQDTPLDVPVSGPQTRRIVSVYSIVHISDSYHGSCGIKMVSNCRRLQLLHVNFKSMRAII